MYVVPLLLARVAFEDFEVLAQLSANEVVVNANRVAIVKRASVRVILSSPDCLWMSVS